MRVGDIYYGICKFVPVAHIEPYIAELEVTEKNRRVYKAVRTDNRVVWFYVGEKDIGKTLFLTREEAEKALAERSENEPEKI